MSKVKVIKNVTTGRYFKAILGKYFKWTKTPKQAAHYSEDESEDLDYVIKHLRKLFKHAFIIETYEREEVWTLIG